MPIYKIADLDIKINPVYDYVKEILSPYMCDSLNFDFEVKFSRMDIIEHANEFDNEFSLGYYENSMILDSVYKTILEKYDGFFFHSSCLAIDNKACAFTAPSGTGKSTHTALWRNMLGSRVVMINDDKPIIRKKDGVFYAYGTPWMGKSGIGNNVKAPLKAVFILKRSEENRVMKVSPSKVIKELLEAAMIDSDRQMVTNLLELINDFLGRVTVFELFCNKDIEAAKTAYDACCEIE